METPPTRSGVIILSLADLQSLDCEAPLAEIRSVDCQSFGPLYREAAAATESAGDDRAALAYRLLAEVSEIHFKPEDRAEPYGPRWVLNGRRSIIPEDLHGEQSAVFAAIAPTLKNPGLRARLADIAWINDRSLVASAQLAIFSYYEAVRLVADGGAELYFDGKASSHTGVQYLRRACQIAQATGWKAPEADDLRSLIGRITQNAFDSGDAGGFLNTARLNLSYGITDPASIALQAEVLAAVGGLYPERARSLWEMAARAHRDSKNSVDEINRCLVNAAECYVMMAEAAGFKGMAAASWLMDAIKALRGIPATNDRRTALEAKLREAQASIHEEMGVISTEIDLTKIIDHSCKAVKGLTLPQAIAEFVRLDQSPAPEDLKKQVLDQAQKNPLTSVIPIMIHDAEGRLVARSPGLAETGESNDEAIQHLIARNEGFRRQITVSGAIEPARCLIMAEHPLHTRHFLALANMSAFVPSGHEGIYAQGFARFFGGDFISALHILAPQLENSLRHVLKQAAIDPSKILNDMTQESRTISVMLEKDRVALEKIFGPAIVLEIENIFDFRGGPSIRHKVAHGLMPAGSFYSHDAIYACWFIFRLCCLPIFPHWKHVAEVFEDL